MISFILRKKSARYWTAKCFMACCVLGFFFRFIVGLLNQVIYWGIAFYTTS